MSGENFNSEGDEKRQRDHKLRDEVLQRMREGHEALQRDPNAKWVAIPTKEQADVVIAEWRGKTTADHDAHDWVKSRRGKYIDDLHGASNISDDRGEIRARSALVSDIHAKMLTADATQTEATLPAARPATKPKRPDPVPRVLDRMTDAALNRYNQRREEARVATLRRYRKDAEDDAAARVRNVARVRQARKIAGTIASETGRRMQQTGQTAKDLFEKARDRLKARRAARVKSREERAAAKKEGIESALATFDAKARGDRARAEAAQKAEHLVQLCAYLEDLKARGEIPGVMGAIRAQEAQPEVDVSDQNPSMRPEGDPRREGNRGPFPSFDNPNDGMIREEEMPGRRFVKKIGERFREAAGIMSPQGDSLAEAREAHMPPEQSTVPLGDDVPEHIRADLGELEPKPGSDAATRSSATETPLAADMDTTSVKNLQTFSRSGGKTRRIGGTLLRTGTLRTMKSAEGEIRGVGAMDGT
jgi:hypothetical protein